VVALTPRITIRADRARTSRAAGQPRVTPNADRPIPRPAATLPGGEFGEIWVAQARRTCAATGATRRPPHRRSRRAAAADGRGWFRTGDAGYLRDGYLFIHDA